MSEEIKYEAVFGEQRLFNDASSEDVLVILNDRQLLYYNEEELKSLEICKFKYRPNLAMRRIIKAPVWTKEDQRAGKLPEVGCVVDWTSEYEGVFRTENNCVVVATDGEEVCIRIHNDYLRLVPLSEIKPIETPEERAKREEREFVNSILKNETSDCSQLWLDAVAHGARAAYRKLKMPEVQK